MVKDSVREIEEECKYLLQLAQNTEERVDIFYNMKKLKESMNDMVAEYDNDSRYNDNKMSLLKQECEEDALALEYCLRLFDSSLNKRFNERIKLNKLKSAYDDLLEKCKRNKQMNKLMVLFSIYNDLEKLTVQSKHIGMELNADEKDMYNCLYEYVRKSGVYEK